MDQESTKKTSAVYNFTPTIMDFFYMWEGQAHSHDTKLISVGRQRMMINWSIINGSNWSSLIKVGSGLHGFCDGQQGYEMFPLCGRSDIDRPLWCACSCGPVWVCGWLPFWRNCRQYRCSVGWAGADHLVAVFDACLWHTKSEHPKVLYTSH